MRDYIGLQGVTMADKRLKKLSGGDKGLQGIQGVTRGYNG